MDRAELERLDRDTLIARAQASGVARPSVLTRPELIDELLVRTAPRRDDPELRRIRGLFGRARDLVARVVERGLHLPDAAERIRSIGLTPLAPRRSVPPAVPTVTLAEIYATQGHRSKAIDTLRRVLDMEPDHAAARSLLAQLEDASYAGPSPVLPPEEEEAAAPAGSSGIASAARPNGSDDRGAVGAKEPTGFLDDAPLPPKYDVDECVAIPVDPTTLFVYWEVRDDTLADARREQPSGAIALRALVIVPTWDGPRTTVRDLDVGSQLGDWFLRDLPAGCVVRTAIGWRSGNAFLPFAHSPALETPPDAPSPLVATMLVRWTPSGAVPVTPGDVAALPIERALARWQSNGVRRARAEEAVYGGSSERVGVV